MEIILHPSRGLRLAQRRWPRQPFHQDPPPLEVRHIPPLRQPFHQDPPLLEVRHLPLFLAKHSLHGRAILSCHFIIQEFGGCAPFSSILPSYGNLDSKLPLATQQLTTLRCGRMDGKDRRVVLNFSLTLWFFSINSHFVIVSKMSNQTCPVL